MTNIMYRKLNSGDAQEFKALRIEAASESPASFHPDPDELRQTSLLDFRAEIGPSDFRAIYGAFDNGELIGTVGLWRDAMRKMWHRANVWGVYTKARYRGRGIARKLMSIAMDDVRSGGRVSILYLSVYSRNSAAKALYKSIGFDTYGLQRHSLLVQGDYVDEELMDLDLGQVAGAGRNASDR